MLEQIIDIVRRAGDIVLSAHDIQNVTREKHGPADLVTQYDEAVQVFLRQELLKLLPEAEFFGEEGERPALTHPWIFVVDPIDGTTNFTRRMNCSSVSVALVHNGHPGPAAPQPAEERPRNSVPARRFARIHRAYRAGVERRLTVMRFCRLFPLPAATFASPIRPRTSAEAGASGFTL